MHYINTKLNNFDANAFRWIPGEGPSTTAVENLRRRFSEHPAQPPGESWFMSDSRRFFVEFVEDKFENIASGTLNEFLIEIASGMNAFPELTEEIANWTNWFNYLLPDLVERADDYCQFFLLESIITAFIRIYSDSIDLELRYDALMTIGRVLMQPNLWEDGELIATLAQDWLTLDNTPVESLSCSEALSASLFFNLMYLPPSCVSTWTSSLLEIQSVHFRAHLLVWLAATNQSFSSKRFSFSDLEKAGYQIWWNQSHLLNESNSEIPTECIEQFRATIKAKLDSSTLSTWMQQILKVEELHFQIKKFAIAEYVAKEVIIAK